MPLDVSSAARLPASSLVLLLKAPDRSKRRLAPQLGDAQARTAASHLLACALEDAADWPGHVVLAPADEAAAQWLASNGWTAHEIVLQRGNTLGERINHIDSLLRSRGLEQLVYIGSDCPTLDIAYMARATAALGRADAVLGPASDGGVVLMAARRAWPSIDDLAWSTSALCDGLLDRLATHRWSVKSLTRLADVDTVEALMAAGAQLATDTRPARRDFVKWLQSVDPIRSEAS